MRRLFLIMLLATTLGWVYAANPFFAGKKNEPATKIESFGKSKPFAFILRVQRDLNRKIAVASKEVHQDWWKLFPLVCLVFAYGVFHALGPGHGKLFSVFYFMSEKVSLPRGILLSLMIGLLHGLMGVLLVLVLKYFLQVYSYLLQQNVSQVIQKTSYLLLSLLGLYLVLKKILHSRATYLGQENKRNGIALALSVAIVPCPGVVMIMLFCVSMGALPLGIILSSFMDRYGYHHRQYRLSYPVFEKLLFRMGRGGIRKLVDATFLVSFVYRPFKVLLIGCKNLSLTKMR